VHHEQLRVLKEKEEDLKSRAREIAAIKDKDKEKENEEKIAALKNEYNMIREIFNQI
jgi:F0F1-type ATP synthase assembly protein I